MTVHELEIDSPLKIEDAVKYVAVNSEDRLFRAGLNHNHISAIRGYGEKEKGLESAEFPYSVESHRKDGGDTWYHSPESRCLMIGVPRTDNNVNNREISKAWGNMLAQKLEEYAEENTDFEDLDPVYLEREHVETEGEAWDVYDRNTGRQLFGLSARNFEDSTVVRTCFYDGEAHGDSFERLLEADGEEPQQFHDSYEPLQGFYDWVLEDVGFEQVRTELTEKNPEIDNKGRRPPKSCVTQADI